MSYNRERRWRAMREGDVCVVMRPVLPQSPHSISGIGPVLVYTNDVFAVGNTHREDRTQKESVGSVRADLNLRIFFSRSRVG